MADDLLGLQRKCSTSLLNRKNLKTSEIMIIIERGNSNVGSLRFRDSLFFSVMFGHVLSQDPSGQRVDLVAVTKGCPRGITWICTTKPVSCGSGWGVRARGGHSREVKASKCW
jgi:hypothetical protein